MVMSAKIPDSHKDLFHKKAFGSFTTLMSDGSPQTTPVWVDFVDGKVLVTSILTTLTGIWKCAAASAKSRRTAPTS
jgi:hypothetical protein